MKKDLIEMVGSILLVGVAMLIVLPACGGATSETAPVPTVQQATATARPATAPAPTPTASASAILPANPQPSPAPVSSGTTDLLATGKLVFEKTAGGVGCAFCHGLDGRGKGPASVNAANIRGKNEGDVRTAFQGGVPMMSVIKLSDEEITAVVAYLQWLATQP